MMAWSRLPAQQAPQLDPIAIVGDKLRVDKMGNAYLRVDNNLYQFAKTQNSYTFEAVNFGTLEQIDATNPLRLVLFYPDLMNIVVVDNTLSQINAINLLELGYQQVTAAARARDNNFWIYDFVDFQLKKITPQGEVLAESENLNVLLEHVVQGNFILEKNNKVYLNDPSFGILVFDAYGTYARKIPITGLDHFQLREDNLVYWADTALIRVNPLLDVELLYQPKSGNAVKEAVLGNEEVILLEEERLLRSFY